MPRPLALALPLLLALLALPACTPYANYPALGEEDYAVNDPNVAPVPQVMTRALAHVLSRYPTGRDYVVNLPEGMARAQAEAILENAGGPQAHLVGEAPPAAPIYHITQVGVLGDTANVEILRPVLTGATGEGPGVNVYQPLTVRLRGGLTGWRVVGVRVWPTTTTDEPPLYGWEEAAE